MNRIFLAIECFSSSHAVVFTVVKSIVMLMLGDLKLVEKPQPVTMGPHDFTNIKASVKVASTENGIIFGNIGMYAQPIWNHYIQPQNKY